MHLGDTVRVKVDGQLRSARVLRILDRRGRTTPWVDLAEPAPFTTVVLALEGGETVCVPLWLPAHASMVLGLRAAA